MSTAMDLTIRELEAEGAYLLPSREALGSLVTIGDINISTVAAVNNALAFNVLSVNTDATAVAWQGASTWQG